MSKISRNSPCPCGSGSKYKHCHGRLDGGPPPINLEQMFRAKDAQERIRRTQQGSGRPIVSFTVGDHRFVGVGNSVHWSRDWKTFPDFLRTYLIQRLGEDWGKAEQEKPAGERHPLIEIFEANGQQLNAAIRSRDGLIAYDVTGASAMFLGVAYGVYLLAHNVELQERLLKRLRNHGNFQGAYYEIWVANALISAGYRLELNDERGGNGRQCEFDAIWPASGKRFSVEAKMRGVRGYLGRSDRDGGPDDELRFKNLLLDALTKPAAGDRLIFIDVNLPHRLTGDGEPDWVAPAIAELEQLEQSRLSDQRAYVFLTNLAFHRQLEIRPEFSFARFGIGIPDFGRPGFIGLGDAWRQKLKHAEAFRILDQLGKLLNLPMTFDGVPASEAFGGTTGRLLVGQTYLFPGGGKEGSDVVATVNDVAVLVSERAAYVSITAVHGGGRSILRAPLSDAELADYRQFGDSLFGKEDHGLHVSRNEFELFEWMMQANAKTSRTKLLEHLGPTHYPLASSLNDKDLLIYYCEAFVAAHVRDHGRSDQRKTPEGAT